MLIRIIPPLAVLPRPEKKEIKAELMKMQDKTNYGLVLGKKKSDGAPNGTKLKPKFNFKVIDE